LIAKKLIHSVKKREPLADRCCPKQKRCDRLLTFTTIDLLPFSKNL